MAAKREPVVKPVPILSLQPTQMTVGIREVKEKRKRWREHKPKKRAEVLGRHMIPVVLGPGDQHYVIDHHHLARALHDEGVKDVLVTVVADLSMVDPRSFWDAMDNHRCVHPYDAKGERQHYYKDCPRASWASRTTPTAASPANCGAPAASPRTPRRSANSCGRISCAGACPRKIVETNFAKAMEKALSLGQEQGRDLSARLVRPGVGRLNAGRQHRRAGARGRGVAPAHAFGRRPIR